MYFFFGISERIFLNELFCIFEEKYFVSLIRNRFSIRFRIELGCSVMSVQWHGADILNCLVPFAEMFACKATALDMNALS